MAADISVIVPTYNERDNVLQLVDRLRQALEGQAWEVVFVDDDSPDGTSRVIEAASVSDPRVRLVRRIGRRGLSSACIEGILSCASAYLVIMDADMQHDEKAIPAMLAALKKEETDLVIGSRFCAGGSLGDLAWSRVVLSRMGRFMTRLLVRTSVQDPLSGFFAFKRAFFNASASRLQGRGFKILLDFLVAAQAPVRFREVPYVFRSRAGGRTKLTGRVIVEYLMLVLRGSSAEPRACATSDL